MPAGILPDALEKDPRQALQRIVVVGSSCAGKSTLASELSALLGQRWVEMDALYWAPHWQKAPTEVFHRRVAECAAGERWVCDGNYREVRDILWPRATAVIWLDYAPLRVFGRALRRTVLRALTRRELWSGNRESFRQSFLSRESILLFVIKTFYRRRRQFTELRAQNAYPQLSWLHFTRPQQAQDFLHTLRCSLTAHGGRCADDIPLQERA